MQRRLAGETDYTTITHHTHSQVHPYIRHIDPVNADWSGYEALTKDKVLKLFATYCSKQTRMDMTIEIRIIQLFSGVHGTPYAQICTKDGMWFYVSKQEVHSIEK